MIFPGVAGMAFVLTVSVRVVPLPQLLFAFTEIIPPEVPAVAFIELVVELPVHPEGNVQVYDVAPDTEDTE